MNNERFGLKMKRVLVTIMTVVMLAGVLAGCGGAKDEAKYLSEIDLEKYVTSLGEYKGMELSATKQTVTDEDVEDYIAYLLDSAKEKVEVTGRAVQTGDVVNIDFEGKKDDVAFEGGTAQGYDLEIGSGSFIDGFEDGLIGCNVGDTVDLNLTFPENYTGDLAGQAVVFTVTVNSISEMVTPELTDEYVKGLEVEDCQNVEEFRQLVRDAMEESAEITFRNELQTLVSEKLLLMNEYAEDVPEGIMNYYKDRIYMSVDAQASYYGMERNDYIVQYLGVTVDEYDKEIEALAITSAQQAMACGLIAQKEGIEVTDEELQAQIELNYANLGYESAEAFNASDEVESYRDVLLATEVLDFLIDNANVTETVAEEATTAEE